MYTLHSGKKKDDPVRQSKVLSELLKAGERLRAFQILDREGALVASKTPEGGLFLRRRRRQR